MTDGAVVILLVAMFAIFFAVNGVRNQLNRIANFCERSEYRMTGKDRP